MNSYLKNLAQRSLGSFMTLVKIMLPVMVVIRIGEEFGLSEMLGVWLRPVMSLVGLPPETGIIWATGMLTGLYGGIGAYIALLPAMELTVAQGSILCAMMLFAHSIPLEQAIVRRAGASFLLTSLLRIGGALLYGAGVAWICSWSGALSEPLELDWLTAGQTDSSWTSWGIATASSLASILAIIVLLFIALDILERLGVIRRITMALEPALRGIGLDSRLAPLTTIGLLLGLTYGGALIIQATKDQDFTPRAKFLALSLLSLSHSLIEDTGLMLALGADVWIILVGRVVFALAVVALLAKVLEYREAAFQ